MKRWQYTLHVILTTPEQFLATESALNARGNEGWEAVTAIPMSGVTGLGKVAILFRREWQKRQASASVTAVGGA